MSLEEILAEKLHAIGTRSAARDLYDVWFLLGEGIKIDRKILDKKFAFYDEKFDAEKAIGNARKSRESWARDLQHLLKELPLYDSLEQMVERRLKEIPSE